MTKHTPGPWTVEAEHLGTNRDFVIEAPEFGIIADIGGGPEVNRRANANLIAAAPELLDACELMLAVYAPLFFPAEPKDAFSIAVLKARAAIAKAQGRS